MCCIREDLWARLGFHLNEDQAISLQTASSETSSTLGVMKDLWVEVAGVGMALQMHVARNSPVEVLLGRPFFAITEAQTNCFANGDVYLTLTDPRDRNRRTKIKATTRVWEREDF